MKGKIKILIVFLILGLFYQVYFRVYQPHQEKTEEIKGEINTQKEILLDQSAFLKGGDVLENEFVEMIKDVEENTEKTLEYKRGGSDRLLQDIIKYSDKSSLSLNDINPEESFSQDDFMLSPLYVSLSGEYDNFITFFNYINGIDYLIRVQNLKLSQENITSLNLNLDFRIINFLEIKNN